MLKTVTFAIAAATLTSFATTAFAETKEAAAPAAPNDAQIAKIVLVADSIDVQYGKIALKKTTNADVKSFAETMVRDHTAVNKQVKELAEKLGVKPEVSDTSKSLRDGAKAKTTELEALEGAAFDKAYVDNEVAYHTSVIGALDTVLLPSAKNEELKALLEKGRPIFVEHLEHAKHLQSELNK